MHKLQQAGWGRTGQRRYVFEREFIYHMIYAMLTFLKDVSPET